MDFDLTDDQKLLKESAREFAQKKLKPLAHKFDEEESVPKEIYDELARMGYFGMAVSEDYGGLGMDAISYICVMEELAKVCAGVQICLSVHNSLVCEALLRYGTSQQKDRYLPRLAKGEIIGAYSLTEPGSGTDAASLKAAAEAGDGYYLVNGNKSWVTSAGFAGLFVVFLLTKNKQESRGISCFLIERGLGGFSVGNKEKKMGLRASDTRELFFQDCRIPSSALLGNQGEGFKIAMSLLTNGRISVAAQAVGIAQAAFEDSVAYAKERRQFGRPLRDFQATQFKLADMAVAIDAARLLTYRAAWMKAKGLACAKEASMAKLYASEMANRVVYQAVQIHGAIGYSRESAVERYFRDARVTEIYEGTSEVQRIVISREIAKSS